MRAAVRAWPSSSRGISASTRRGLWPRWCICLRPCGLLLLPPHHHGDLLEEGYQRGRHCGHDLRIVFTAAYIIYFKFVNPSMNTAANWWWGISPEGIGTIGMLINFIAMFLVSKITKEPPQEVQRMVESLRYPRTI